MKNNKSKHNTIETLSAYLDGQLSEGEAEVVRQQLEQDGVLRNQLEDLRQTRYVLRQTPKLKRRRSFVLSPEMVKQQRTFFQALTVSRVISTAASVLLVVLLGSQYLLSGGMGLASAPMADVANYQMAEEAVAEDSVAAEAPVEEPAAEEPMMAMEAPEEEPAEELVEELETVATDSVEEPTGEAAEDAAGTGAAEADEPPPAVADRPAEEIQGTQLPTGGGGEPPEDEDAAEEASEAVLPTATMEGTLRSMPMEKDADDAADGAQEGEVGLAPELPDEELAPMHEETEPGELRPDGPDIRPMQVAQGILLILAVAGGLAAAYFRKKVR